jgi:hypothetical protein
MLRSCSSEQALSTAWSHSVSPVARLQARKCVIM